MSATGSPSASSRESATPAAVLGDPRRRLRILGVPLLGLLAVEFLLGMALNLYITIPGGSPVSIVEADPILIGHIVVGVLLLGITSQVLGLGVKLQDRRAEVAGAIGLLSAVVASLGGMDFTFGGQNAAVSYVMSVGFTGVLFSAALLFLPRVSSAGTVVEIAVQSEPGNTAGGRS
jgi:hypothetical protein